VVCPQSNVTAGAMFVMLDGTKFAGVYWNAGDATQLPPWHA
jgi:hypothetical protein